MKTTRVLMGMPITVEIVSDLPQTEKTIGDIFDYFTYVDETFSTYKDSSEIMRINRGELALADASPDMQEIFRLAEATRTETAGYFDIVNRKGILDPSGIVKGWAIRNAAARIRLAGFENYYVDAGGDIESRGLNAAGRPWSIGIKNPFEPEKIVKVVYPSNKGVATSGTYIRGQHIYNPRDKTADISDIVSLTVIGPDVYEADRFATAAFAMGEYGINFIEKLDGLEGYVIDKNGIATMTSGFAAHTQHEIDR